MYSPQYINKKSLSHPQERSSYHVIFIVINRRVYRVEALTNYYWYITWDAQKRAELRVGLNTDNTNINTFSYK